MPDNRVTFARDLGLFDASMIGIGAMIGAGIFALTGQIAELAGSGATLVLGPRAVLTPLARERARALGVTIEKERR